MYYTTKTGIEQPYSKNGGNRIVQITMENKLNTWRVPGRPPEDDLIAGHPCPRKRQIEKQEPSTQ